MFRRPSRLDPGMEKQLIEGTAAAFRREPVHSRFIAEDRT
jgi:hypothetical protein